jgi:hypothetical protein
METNKKAYVGTVSYGYHVRAEAKARMNSGMTMLFFWVVAPCRDVGMGRQKRFGETYCFHFQG